MIPTKQLLLIMCGVVVLGCGEATSGSKTKVLTESETAVEAKAGAWVSDPSDPNNIIIEKQIRIFAKKPTGKLAKADLDKLTTLDLAGNQLTEVTGLEKLSQLKWLLLGGNQLTEVPEGLEKLTQLEVLFINDNQLTYVKGLEKLTQLTNLHLEGNQLTNVKGLEKLTQLETLNLSYNQPTEVPKGLENLTQLKVLLLNHNQLTDVKVLERLTQLKTLWLRNNPDLTKAQIAELKKALPKCEIHSNPTK